METCKQYNPIRPMCRKCNHRPKEILSEMKSLNLQYWNDGQLIQSIKNILDFQWVTQRDRWICELRKLEDYGENIFSIKNTPEYYLKIFEDHPETKDHYFYNLVILKQFLIKLKE